MVTDSDKYLYFILYKIFYIIYRIIFLYLDYLFKFILNILKILYMSLFLNSIENFDIKNFQLTIFFNFK